MSSLLEDISEIEMRTYRVDYKDSTGELQCSVLFFNTERHISDLITSYLMTNAFIYLQDHNHYPEYVKPIIYGYLGSKMLEG